MTATAASGPAEAQPGYLEAFLSTPFVKLNLIQCQAHKENNRRGKAKNSNTFPSW